MNHQPLVGDGTHHPRPAAAGLCAIILAISMASASSSSASLFFDDFETGTAKWALTGNWGTSTARAVSPTRSLADSPGAFYANNTNAAATMAESVDLATLARPVLVFHHGHSLEQGYDFGRVEISTDGGTTWADAPLASYTGVRRGMTREQIALDDFAAAADAKIRFRIVTDASVVMEGWYVDDVRIATAPEPATLNTPDAQDIAQTAMTHAGPRRAIRISRPITSCVRLPGQRSIGATRGLSGRWLIRKRMSSPTSPWHRNRVIDTR